MAKKLKVWLNNKLNKRLRCTVVIKFYRIFITELVLNFFVYKCPNYFEFPKCGKRSPHLKILEIPGGRGGSSKTPWNGKSWEVGGGCKSKSLLWWGYGYFLEPHNRGCKNCAVLLTIKIQRLLCTVIKFYVVKEAIQSSSSLPSIICV